MKQIKVGQKVWVVPSRLWRGNKEPYEATVVSVGRKYFQLDSARYEKYSLETLLQENETNYQNKVYLTYQEILDEREYVILWDKLRKTAQSFGKPTYTLDQLRKVAEILSLTETHTP